MNKRKKSLVDGQWVPDRNEEYLIYQTLVGVWPLQSMDETGYDIFKKRIKDYMLKAVREAKVNTSWISPNTPYEENLTRFIDAILSPSSNNPFIKDFEVFQKKVSYFGMFNSLSQILLKMTCPGVPDFYQGTELWDFNLVDPDNRRPVDYDIRKRMLNELKQEIERSGSDLRAFARRLMENWVKGTIKLYITFISLNYRKENAQLFWDGNYIPLESEGNLKDHVCAFSRKSEGKVVLVVVPRFLTRILSGSDEMPLGQEIWGDSRIVIPEEVSGNKFNNIFTGETIEETEQDGQGGLALGEIFANFPVAMLEKV